MTFDIDQLTERAFNQISAKITSVSKLIDKLQNIEVDNDHVLFYRGHSSSRYKLQPNIYRNNLFLNEDIIFKELLLRCPHEFSHCRNTFDFLVKMQHYSLPTRLLDITTNPLIALYFCVSSNNNKSEDGEILVFKIPKKEIKYYDSDTVSIISNLSKRPRDFKIDSSMSMQKFNEVESIKYLIHEIRAEKPYFSPVIIPKDLESVVCVKPKLDNPRIIRQDGAFLLFGINGEKGKCAEFPKHYLIPEQKKIIIDHKYKNTLKKHLALLGITQATVYPDIEKVADYISKTYTQKDEINP